MAGHGGKKRGKRQRHDDHGEHVDERWLLTYSDLITLLMALFMVLFSISSVNISKYVSLQHSLQDAFSGRILPGGRALEQSGGSTTSTQFQENTPTIKQTESASSSADAAKKAKAAAQQAAKAEQENFKKLKARIDAYTHKHGLDSKV